MGRGDTTNDLRRARGSGCDRGPATDTCCLPETRVILIPQIPCRLLSTGSWFEGDFSKVLQSTRLRLVSRLDTGMGLVKSPPVRGDLYKRWVCLCTERYLLPVLVRAVLFDPPTHHPDSSVKGESRSHSRYASPTLLLNSASRIFTIYLDD